MRKRTSDFREQRMLTAQEAAGYCGMGLTTFRQWGAQIGARKVIGNLVRYDRQIIDAVIDSAEVNEAK